MKSGLNYKLRSGALQFTVFISVLIALLLSGLILYAYTFGYFKEQSKATIENIQLSGVAMNHLLHQTEVNKDTLLLDVIEKENQIIKVHLSPWGIFEKAFTETQHRKKIFKKTAIIGSIFDTEQAPTLYLQETFNPLTLVGSTKIKGIAYLPPQGVKPGYIAGQSYYGTTLIDGKIEKSNSSLPKLPKSLYDQMQFYVKSYKPESKDDFIELRSNKRTVNSFRQKTKNIYSTQQIILENVAVSGNIIIKSEEAIIVKRTASLKDVILIAPIIEIEEETVGNFQAIASKKLTVGKKCKLNYPSALVLYQDNQNQATEPQNKLDNQLFVATGTTINGGVCYFQTRTTLSNFETQIVIEEKANIRGQVYCEGSLELKGVVSGSVYTKQFIANQSGSVYINHIYNGIIENENIPKRIGGLVLEKEPKIVLKWLY